MSQLRKIRYRLFAWKRFPQLQSSAEAIDVVIPIVGKDLRILPLCLEGVYHCVAHPIQQIYIVAPAQDEIVCFCEEHGLQFVDEREVFGFGPKDLNLQIQNADGSQSNRSGWLFQQLIKLSVLIRPHVFLTQDNKTVFYMSYEEHQPYYDNIHRLLPDLALDKLSYVDHKMLFDKQQVERLHQALTQGTGLSWTDVVLKSYDRSSFAGFSEFELYGNFVVDKVQRPWLQKRLPYKKMADYDTLQRQWSRSRWSLTFPDYMRQNKKE